MRITNARYGINSVLYQSKLKDIPFFMEYFAA